MFTSRLEPEPLKFKKLRQTLAMVHSNIAISAKFKPTIIKEIIAGKRLTNSSKFAIFVTYTTMPYVASYVLYHLDHLNKMGWNVVVVSNRCKISDESLNALQERSAFVLLRPNIGYDFGAYRDGIIWLLNTRKKLSALLIMNDSVFGPLYPETPILQDALDSDEDIVGLIESFDVRFHFQSYWIVFKNRLISSQDFLSFWTAMPYRNAKIKSIKMEVNLISHFLRKGFKAKALFKIDDICKKSIEYFQKEIKSELTRSSLITSSGQIMETASLNNKTYEGRVDYLKQVLNLMTHGVALNPSIYMWKPLIETMKFPYIKRELFVKNPMSEPNIIQAFNVVDAAGYSSELILQYLRGQQ